MALIFAGVDGTGPDDDKVYAETFKHSFVHTIYNLTPAANRYYHRGPTMAGFQTGPLAIAVTNFVLENIEKDKKAKVCLSGYSRGGAAVIRAAKNLDPLPVDYLVLFDAVDRSFVDAQSIPGNVKEVIHAKRDPKAGSREGFSNCGLSYDSKDTKKDVKEFYATHGGLGGTPWASDPSVNENKAFAGLFGGTSGKWKQKIEELTPDQAAKAEKAAKAASWISNDAAAKIRARTAIERYTNVTYEQDVDGALETWNWIAPRLLQRGIITNANWPWANLKATLSAGKAS